MPGACLQLLDTFRRAPLRNKVGGELNAAYVIRNFTARQFVPAYGWSGVGRMLNDPSIWEKSSFNSMFQTYVMNNRDNNAIWARYGSHDDAAGIALEQNLVNGGYLAPGQTLAFGLNPRSALAPLETGFLVKVCKMLFNIKAIL